MAVVSWLSNDNEVTKNKIRDDNIAPIESNALSASKTYTVGKSFVLDSDGKLYKATQQIDQGSAIITNGENANCEEVTNGAEGIFGTKQDILNLNSAVGNLASRVGRAEGNITTLNEIKANTSDLGTASTKNSTSVVTQSTDLVESGAVKDIVGWGNKNKFPLTIDGIKAVNTSGTWSGNTYTVGNGTFELQSIDGKNVSKIVVNKLASTIDNPALNLPTFTLPKGNYVLNGVPSGGSSSKYYCQLYSNVDYPSGAGITDFGDGKEFTLTTTNTIQRGIVSIRPNNVFTNLEFELIVCDADLIDKSYEPYHESVEDTLRDAEVIEGKNLFNLSIINWTNYTYADGLVKNNIIDTRISLLLLIQGRKNGSFVKELMTSLPITAVGNYEVEFTIGSSDDINQLYIGHNGGSNNIMFIYPFNLKGTYKLSFKATGINPTVVNGIILTDIMISVSGGAYEPYYTPLKNVVPNKCDNSVIGTVEDGATASQDYSVGQHFIRDGAFCTCTQPIASRGSFILGTNYTVGDVADSLIYTVDYTIPKLSDLNWTTQSQISYAGVATSNVLPNNAKLIGATACEPWGSNIDVFPLIAIASNNRNLTLVIKSSDTPGIGQFSVRLTYILI